VFFYRRTVLQELNEKRQINIIKKKENGKCKY